MDANEIEHYVSLGSHRVCCVYRERLPDIDTYAMSIYVTGSPGQYGVSVEFDPIAMIDEGEGWIWRSEPMSLIHIIELLEKFTGQAIADWENVTKTGKLDCFTCHLDEPVAAEHTVAFKAIRFGEDRLPPGFIWVKQ
jgi:hypothetical protein